MRLFGRNQNQNISHVESPFEDEDELVDSPEEDAEGPFDLSEKPDLEGYLDLGSLRLPVQDGMNLQIEVSENTNQVIAVTVVLGQSSLQLQPFAAPKRAGLWSEISEQLIKSLHQQEAEVAKKDGRWGEELLARVPASMPDGSPGWRVARFIGIDGNRWFLRAVVAGQAAMENAETAIVEDYLSRVVVDRGTDPMPPRDLLPLSAPTDLPGQPTVQA
ncbi:DUF3710 domain-containing protein [Micrococcoides hystricis]|uniref:DUF3710 domain-containing protein n=1 Tax=Micrococcoides hystricis TaxID=1572761 RepID=A0ABV6P8D7_9MICC